MITAERLRDCLANGVTHDLLVELGYPIEPVRIDLEQWRDQGLDLHLDPAATLERVARVSDVEVYALEGADEGSGARLVAALARRNALINPLVFCRWTDRSRLSIAGLAPNRRPQRFDLDLVHPKRDALDRLNLLRVNDWKPEVAGLSREVARALDRDVIARRFFEGFRRAVSSVRDELRSCCPGVGDDDLRDEALLLLSRILFLYFVQERGWLDGNRTFLADRLRHAHAEGRSAFRTVLVPLFFGCLNTPRDRRSKRSRELGDIPYLNGGLFERSELERSNRRLSVSNALLLEIVEELFEHYAFTVREDDEERAHLDPEMLGKVFESLMAADDRACSGSFYTPREIVDVLVRRATLESLAGEDSASRARLEALCDGESPAMSSSEAQHLLRSIENLRVVDPACGSGAFLLAALALLERLAKRLYEALRQSPPSDLRQRIVERSLYGVDVKAEAVRLCELRLWLAIVAARRGGAIEAIPPLPNLDRNVLQGNSLLAPIDFPGDLRMELYRQWRRALDSRAELTERYRGSSPRERVSIRRALRDADRSLALDLLDQAIQREQQDHVEAVRPIRDLFGEEHSTPKAAAERGRIEQRLAELRSRREAATRGDLGFFSWDVQFAEVMQCGGFDVVIGNPPWVRHARIPRSMRRMLSDRYELFGGRGFDQSDLCVAFFELSMNLARSGGVVALLVPSKLLTAGYGSRLRMRLAREHRILALDDWTGGQRYFDADTFPVGITVQRDSDTTRRVSVSVSGHRFRMPQQRFETDAAWSLVPPEVERITRRLRERFPPLAADLGRKPLMGIKTGANRCFFLDGFELVGGVARHSASGIEIPAHFLSRVVRGRDVRRFRAESTTWMLWPPLDGWTTPPEWAATWAEMHSVSVECLRFAYLRPEHLGLKVVWKDVSRGLQAVLVPETTEIEGRRFPLVPNQTLYSLDVSSTSEGYWWSALMNSIVFNTLALLLAAQAKDRHYRYFGRSVAHVPVPAVSSEERSVSVLIGLSRRAHRGIDVQNEIDRHVAELYGVSKREHETLREYVEQRIGSR